MFNLILNSLRHYWRTHLGVFAGVDLFAYNGFCCFRNQSD